MKYILAISIIICSSFIQAPGQAVFNLKSVKSGDVPGQVDPPIKVSAPRYRWFRITNEAPREFNVGNQRVKTPGMAMLKHDLNISYDRGTYDKDKVSLVTELEYTEKGGKLMSYKTGVEADVKTATGVVWTVWALSGKSLSGRGVMKIYLAENKKNGKVLSNILTIPTAADDDAARELQAELGPWVAPEKPSE